MNSEMDLWSDRNFRSSEVDLFSTLELFSNPLNDPFLLTKGATICLNQPSTKLSIQAAIVKCVIAHAGDNWTVFGAIGSRFGSRFRLSNIILRLLGYGRVGNSEKSTFLFWTLGGAVWSQIRKLTASIFKNHDQYLPTEFNSTIHCPHSRWISFVWNNSRLSL